ncbi:hypothetical protein I6F53_20225, partial [Pseudoalteromonas sp. SWN29]
MPILDTEFELVGEIVAQDEGWIAALAKRGVTVNDVEVVPLSSGYYDFPEEEGRRILRIFAFRSDYVGDHVWAHPIDGLAAYVDIAAMKVTRIVDSEVYPIPAEGGNYDDPAVQGPPLDALKPIVITQPEGPSYLVDGEQGEWGNWKFQIGFDMREGLIMRNLSFADQGVDRPIMYRGSISEMVVPYADPQPNRFWQNYFDTGEYLFGR